MKTNQKQGSYIHKFGLTTTKNIKNVFKFNRTFQSPVTSSHFPAGTASRSEIEDALALEAEARRQQGRTYASLTPFR